MKKIIIILTIIILILIVAIAAFNFSRTSTTQTDSDTIPTGIIVPTKEIVAGELDIVAISPKDNDTNVGLDSPIEITFSRNFTFGEIEFFINPNTSYDTEINENKLTIKPDTNWNVGTYYTFSVNFAGEPEKVRLYHFTTTGPTQEFLPDTQPENGYEDLLNEQKANDTDNYVTNHTPYETATFSVKAAYESQVPSHFYFTITRKIPNEQQVSEDVNVWLQSLDLSAEQIANLDIRYQ